MQNVLVIDQGSHSTRVLVFNPQGSVLASASASIKTSYHPDGRIEQSPHSILQSVHSVLAQLENILTPEVLGNIAAAALIVQRSSFLACRKDNVQALTAVISWQDTRNKKLIDDLSVEQQQFIAQITGLRANAHYGASKMRWLVDNDLAVRQALSNANLVFLPLAAYLAFHVAGTSGAIVDAVIASRTLLTALGEMQWHDSLLQLFGIEKSCLPRIVPTQYDFGQITIGRRNVPLAVLGGDQSFIPFAEGVPVDYNTAYVNVGTGAFVQMPVTSTPHINGMLYSPLAISSAEKILVLEGTVNAAATALDWLWSTENSQLMIADINRALHAENAPPLFINTLAGTGSPWWLPAQEPCFMGKGNLAAKAVAVIESIVFALMDNIHCLQVANPSLATLLVGGGLSQFDGFCQKLANISGLKVRRPDMHEISALGAAMYLVGKTQTARSGTIFIPQEDKPLLERYKNCQAVICNGQPGL